MATILSNVVRSRGGAIAAIAAVAVVSVLGLAANAADQPERGEEYHRDFVFGVPDDPTEDWTLVYGGRVYDKWWEALETTEPTETHPAYPAGGKQAGKDTWRCKECHGWDYKGAAGAYAKGSHFTGIKGVEAMIGAEPGKIAAALRAEPHGFSAEQIPDAALERLALFISKGQHDADAYIDRATKKAKGDVEHGHKLYQAVCAACHGFDGKSLNFGDAKEPEFVGTLAVDNPWEALHKIRNGQPAIPMPAWRAFDIQYAVDVIAYAQTLPVK